MQQIKTLYLSNPTMSSIVLSNNSSVTPNKPSDQLLKNITKPTLRACALPAPPGIHVTSNDANTTASVLDTLTELERLISEEEPNDAFTYQADSTWLDFCDDLPMDETQ